MIGVLQDERSSREAEIEQLTLAHNTICDQLELTHDAHLPGAIEQLKHDHDALCEQLTLTRDANLPRKLQGHTWLHCGHCKV